MKRCWTINGRKTSDVELRGDSIFNEKILPFWNGARFRFYDTGTDHPLDSLYQVSSSNLTNQISLGYNIIHMDTHGSSFRWALEKDGDFTIVSARNVTNRGYSLIVTSSCHTNRFSHSTCLSESLMRNPNSGILGYWGCSTSGWFYPNKKDLGPSDLRNVAFYKYLFSDTEKHLGEVALKAKMDFIGCNMDTTEVNRWLHFGLNLLGDPEMPVFTATPLTFNNVSFSNNNGYLSINTNVDSCRICVMGKNNGTLEYYEVYNNASDMPILDNPITMNYSICVTKPGYVPYVVYVLKDHFIQNDTITDNRIYISDPTSIGSDVTPQQENGPVAIEGGKTIIFNQSGIMIKNDFEVKEGAIFEIK